MTRLWWFRHGPTHARTMCGWTDLPADLSDTGQVARQKALLPAGALVISSDLTRAVATADALAGDRVRLPHDPDLREIHFGAWEGLTADECTARDGAAARAFWEQPGPRRAPDGESWDGLCARVGRAVARLVAAHPGRDLAIVAHLGPILTQVQAARGCSAYQAMAQTIRPLSLTEIRIDPTAREGAPRLARVDYLA